MTAELAHGAAGGKLRNRTGPPGPHFGPKARRIASTSHLVGDVQVQLLDPHRGLRVARSAPVPAATASRRSRPSARRGSPSASTDWHTRNEADAGIRRRVWGTADDRTVGASEHACMGFLDRRDAGRRLARNCCRLALEHPVVIALPRGGVPVGFEVATMLEAPLDLRAGASSAHPATRAGSSASPRRPTPRPSDRPRVADFAMSSGDYERRAAGAPDGSAGSSRSPAARR
jgi:hypothetical protein